MTCILEEQKMTTVNGNYSVNGVDVTANEDVFDVDQNEELGEEDV